VWAPLANWSNSDRTPSREGSPYISFEAFYKVKPHPAAGCCANLKITRREYVPIGSNENILVFDGYFCIYTDLKAKSKKQKAKSKKQKAKSKKQKAKIGSFL
uniref:hypothetical protein n=1 Tax=uncultured Shewanella sp. TaxID=173975 RepID=UPI002606D9EE